MILASVVLTLRGPGRPDPTYVRGFFYQLLSGIEPHLHDAKGLRPFTLACGGRSDTPTPYLRVTMLSERVYANLSPSLYKLVGSKIILGPTEYRVTAVLQEDHAWANLTTYDRLFRGEGSPDLSLRFITPTFFRRHGANYALPEPTLVFSSFIERWNAFAPAPVPEKVGEALRYRTVMRKFQLQTHHIEAHEPTVGVLGSATYHLRKASGDELGWLTALRNFAFYSPLGAKTTLGFGQVLTET